MFDIPQQAERLLLQAAQFAQQGRQLGDIASLSLDFLGKTLERLANVAGRLQIEQLPGQGSQRGKICLATLLTTVFGVEYGFFQARDQPGKTGIEIVATDNLA